MKCPYCGSVLLRMSKHGNAESAFPLSWFMVWVRCGNCCRRFRRFGLFPGRKIYDPLKKADHHRPTLAGDIARLARDHRPVVHR